jgi:hypothetical protein
VSAASFRSGLASSNLRETVRPHFPGEVSRTHCRQTPHPSGPHEETGIRTVYLFTPAVLALRSGVKESERTALRCRDRASAGGSGDRLNFGSAATGMKDASPVATQELLSTKPPPCRIPLRVSPRHRVPASSPRDSATAGPVH